MRTATDSDDYTLTFDYDSLDRQTKVTYPDGTFELTEYERLDAVRSRDRLGRWTHRVYDAIMRMTATTDPLGRTVTQQWCSCGSMDALMDANGNATKWERDVQGRMTKEIRANGSEWLYVYETTTSRLKTVTYPNGQTSAHAYYSNSGDHRLQEIHHRTSSEVTVSKFNYTYDAVGNLKTWTQQQDTNPPEAYDFEYGRADRLRRAVWSTTDPAPTILKRYAYTYDPAGNRTVEQIDNAPVLAAYDNMNRLASQTPGGTMRFAGTISEAATVTIQSQPARVSTDNRFERDVAVSSGANEIVVKARDYSGNETTETYEVSVSGSTGTFLFDANGNMTSDGTSIFESDAEDRLIAVTQGTHRSELSYDGKGRWTRILEKENDTVISDSRYVWCSTVSLRQQCVT